MKLKARLVGKGFVHNHEIDFEKAFCVTCGKYVNHYTT
jgi:hypothetical protein